MIVLSIDTSCDDTSVAVVEKKKEVIKILSNIVSSQIEIHQEYGGVFPMLAQREHQKNLVPVLRKALLKAKLLEKGNSFKNYDLKRETDLKENLTKFLKKTAKPNIDAISVTEGPGLEPCLWVGINFAKALSYVWDLPIIAVNLNKSNQSTNKTPPILKDKAYFVSVPFEMKKIKHALNNFPSSYAKNKLSAPSNRHYNWN